MYEGDGDKETGKRYPGIPYFCVFGREAMNEMRSPGTGLAGLPYLDSSSLSREALEQEHCCTHQPGAGTRLDSPELPISFFSQGIFL